MDPDTPRDRDMNIRIGRVTYLMLLATSGVLWLDSRSVSSVEAITPQTIYLSPGGNIQSAVDAAPSGTTFVLRSGIYRMQSVTPKQNDTFLGQGPGVVLNGSTILTFRPASTANRLWVARAIATPSSAESNRYYQTGCEQNHPLCAFTQDLFIDGQLQTPANGLAGLRPGQWFFDRSHSLAYLPADPQGHVVELGMTPYAFSGPAGGVTIRNLTVEKYASWPQRGAIGGDTASLGAFWKVDRVEVRWNHGTGVGLGSSSQILNSFIHHNGQLGAAVHGKSSMVAGNEISWNNYIDFKWDAEAGGAKFCETSDLVVRSNYVHDNNGTGLWTDIGAVGTLYEKNTVVRNKRNGIQHEISYGGVIRYNVVKDNGSIPTSSLWYSQILLQASSGVQVYDNTIEVAAGYGNGIGIMNESRGQGKYGPYVAANNSIHSNTITYLGSSGYSGLDDSAKNNSAVGNVFDSNRYITAQSGAYHWMWSRPITWKQFQTAGQEKHGSCCK